MPAKHQQNHQNKPAAVAPSKEPVVAKTQVKEVKAKSKYLSLLGERKFDFFFIFGYLLFFAAICFLVLARCNHIFPDSIAQISCEPLGQVQHLFRYFTDTVKIWGERVLSAKLDFSLRLVHRVNVFFTAPLSLLLAFGFLTGSQWTKNWGMIHAGVMLYNMIAVDLIVYNVMHMSSTQPSALDGPHARHVAIVVYGFLTFFPVAVLLRLWRDRPFERTSCPAICTVFCFFWKLFCVSWMFAAVIAAYEFSVKNTSSWKDMPSVVDSSSEMWVKSAPHRASAEEYFGIFLEQAYHYSQFAYKEAVSFLGDLGNKINEFFAKKN